MRVLSWADVGVEGRASYALELGVAALQGVMRGDPPAVMTRIYRGC